MSQVRRRDTTPELSVRRILHSRGLRYRVAAPIPGLSRRSADLLFTGPRVAVFIDGCYWHGCADHKSPSKTKPELWATKLRRNQDRDRETDEHLRRAGWHVARHWEHEDPTVIADQVEAAVRSRSTRRAFDGSRP
jgi:DNA mismatch endonuclease (patch repair protein)